MGTSLINPNHESTLTSISSDTPVPVDNYEHDTEDVVLINVSQIFADSVLHNCQGTSFSKEQEINFQSEWSGSPTDTEEPEPRTSTNEYFDIGESSHFATGRLTYRDDELSFSDKSDGLSSPFSQGSDHFERQLSDPVQQCPPEEVDIIYPLRPPSKSKREEKSKEDQSAFLSLRLTYLVVTLVVMLADGMQGTHLYVLYESYGFSVASLYCLGFVTGGLASPITGPLVDKLGRKKSALLYCILEIVINMLEQYPVLAGLIVSRMVGGITTNLLSTVFDAWLDTEYRRRGLSKEGYEIIMRDSVIVSNLAAIGSGYLAHILADRYGAVGPFEGAVTFTSIALVVVIFVWTENYGAGDHQVKGMKQFLWDAVAAFKADNKVLRVGVIQGFTCASIQIFIFLWSPALRYFARSACKDALGLDDHGEPAYGLIFGAFMAAGVCGGIAAPFIRQLASFELSPSISKADESTTEESHDDVRLITVETFSAFCYVLSALLLLVPCVLPGEDARSFSICLGAFLIYEFMVGLYLPCEGVIRSIYFPAEGRASIMTLPRIIVNVAVSMGVISTTFVTMRSAFSSIVVLMLLSAVLQLSLISTIQWPMLSAHFLSCSLFSSEGKPHLSRMSSSASDTERSMSKAACSSNSFLCSDLAHKFKRE